MQLYFVRYISRELTFEKVYAIYTMYVRALRDNGQLEDHLDYARKRMSVTCVRHSLRKHMNVSLCEPYKQCCPYCTPAVDDEGLTEEQQREAANHVVAVTSSFRRLRADRKLANMSPETAYVSFVSTFNEYSNNMDYFN
jgi:hypothetical protein